MSGIKKLLYKLEEQADDRRLAKLLNITYEELTTLNWEINTNESNDGLIYSYILKFKKNSPREVLKKIKRLESNNMVFLEPWELEGEYDFVNDQFDAITESRINHTTFNNELDNLKKLSILQTEGDELKQILNRQIFISIIGTLESFLSETFVTLVFDDKMYFQNFVQSHPEYRSQKFELREIFQKQSELNSIVKKTILDTIFHNLPTVRNMYQDTFEIRFPSIKSIIKHVIVRHDLVHRNGKTKSGKTLQISDILIDKLIRDVKEFIFQLCIKLEIYNIEPEIE